jgi:UDP-N-acetylenolpyruvoylglucosamine reductase
MQHLIKERKTTLEASRIPFGYKDTKIEFANSTSQLILCVILTTKKEKNKQSI